MLVIVCDTDNELVMEFQTLTHVLGSALAIHKLPVVAGDLPGSAEVNQLDVHSASALHDDIVWLEVEVDYTTVVEELQGIQYLRVIQQCS